MLVIVWIVVGIGGLLVCGDGGVFFGWICDWLGVLLVDVLLLWLMVVLYVLYMIGCEFVLVLFYVGVLVDDFVVLVYVIWVYEEFLLFWFDGLL